MAEDNKKFVIRKGCLSCNELSIRDDQNYPYDPWPFDPSTGKVCCESIEDNCAAFIFNPNKRKDL